MTHTTGPRRPVVARLARAIDRDIAASGATITECMEAMHEVQVGLVRIALRPWEDENCPTCPRDMVRRGRHIMAKRGLR